MPHSRLTYQLQALGIEAVRQQLDDAGRPAGPIEQLTPWANIVRTSTAPYPEQLYEFLFGKGAETSGLHHDGILSLQLQPTGHQASLAAVVRHDLSVAGEPLDWMQIFPWETLSWALWRKSGAECSFANWLTAPGSTRVVRSFWGTAPLDTVRPANGLMRVLVAWAETPDKASLQADAQFVAVNTLVEALGQLGSPLAVTALRGNVTIDELCKAIAEANDPLYIVHLIAHGVVGADGVGRLLLASPNGGRATEEHARQIAQAIAQHREKHDGCVPALFLLNACLSGATDGVRPDDSVARTICAAGVPYVVANQAAIYVGEMNVFTQAFYRALGHRMPVDQAVQAGRKALLSFSPDDPLYARTRVMPTPAEAKLLPGGGGLPTWAVPILYMPHKSDGYLAGWKPYRRIMWPLDGKVMVYVDWGEYSFYIDECQVTEAQYEQYSQGHQPPVFDTTLADAREQDDGMPQTNLSAHAAQKYAAAVCKRLPSPTQWEHLAAQSGLFNQHGKLIIPDRTNRYVAGVCVPGEVEAVRAREPQGTIEVWSIAGNTFEIAAETSGGDLCFYRISSASHLKEPFAYNESVRNNPISDPRTASRVYGFRTVALWQDIDRLVQQYSKQPQPLCED